MSIEAPAPAPVPGPNRGAAVVDALRTQPLAIALVVINLLFLVTGAYFWHGFVTTISDTAQSKDKMMMDLINKCGPRTAATDT